MSNYSALEDMPPIQKKSGNPVGKTMDLLFPKRPALFKERNNRGRNLAVWLKRES